MIHQKRKVKEPTGKEKLLPTAWNELNSFYLIVGVIGIPLLLGFLTEAGKDIYNKVTKKPTPDSYFARCRETQINCQKELATMHSLDTFMLDRQTDLRERRLPRIETQLEVMIEKQDSMFQMLADLKQQLKDR